MPSPNISINLRQQWREISDQQIIAQLTSRGVDVQLMNRKNRHFKITGAVRPVELYATTGTVNAARHQQRQPCKFTQMQPSRAFERVLALANIGH